MGKTVADLHGFESLHLAEVGEMTSQAISCEISAARFSLVFIRNRGITSKQSCTYMYDYDVGEELYIEVTLGGLLPVQFSHCHMVSLGRHGSPLHP